MRPSKQISGAVLISICFVLFYLPATLLAQNSDFRKIESAVRQVSERQLATVVSIRMYDTKKRKVSEDMMFSGVVVDTSGYILTSAHSMMPDQVYQIRFPDGKTFIANSLGRILSNDAALLKITEKGTWPFSKMSLSNTIRKNELCIGISYAGSLGQSQPNVRFGYVAEAVTQNGSFRSTCLMEPGDSGGPVFDLTGKVIGIHSRIEIEPDRNFEIPIATYRKYWKALLVPKTYNTPPETDAIPPGQIGDKSFTFLTFQKIEAYLRKDETNLQKSVLKLSSISDGRQVYALATLVKPNRLTEKKPSGNVHYLVSKNSIVGDQPFVLFNNKSIKARIIRRNEARDLVLLEFESKLNNHIGLSLESNNEQRGEIGKFLISAFPERAACISVFGKADVSIKTPQYPGLLRAAIEMKDGHVVVKDTLTTNPFSPSTLKIGDQLLLVNNKEIKVPQDLINQTSGYFPGHEIALVLMRAGKRIEENIKLSSITDFAFHIADKFADGKSRRRYGFERVFIHDGQLKPSECGGPVFDSKGEFCGINLARFSRTSTLAVPANEVADFVEEALLCKENKMTSDGSLSAMLDYFVAMMNLKFTPPSGMKEIKAPVGMYAPRANTGFLDGPSYMLKPENEDVLIAAGVNPIWNNRTKNNYNDHIHKLNYLVDMRPLFIEKNGQSEKVLRDSTFDHPNDKIRLYQGKELEMYGADEAGIIEVPTDNPYQNKYHNLRIIFMYKRGIGEVYIQYFYNKDTDIDKYVNKTKYMLKFN